MPKTAKPSPQAKQARKAAAPRSAAKKADRPELAPVAAAPAKARKTAAAKTAAKPAAEKSAKPAAKPAAVKKTTAKKTAAKPAKPAGKPTSKALGPRRVPRTEEHAVTAPAPREALRDDSPLLAFDDDHRSGKYVYCIIQTEDAHRFGRIGIGNEPADVHTVNYKDIAAVVSDTPLEVYDPTRENVLAHERVNEVVMRDYTVIPMSFSTVFKTSEDIIELLRTAYDAFRDVLVKMQDKLEFGVKVLWEPEVVIREIEKNDENLRLLRQEISSQKGSTYFARMQYGRLVDSLLAERSEQLVSDIFNALSSVSVASRANKPIGDKMVLNAAFLVSRDRESDFDTKVKEMDAKYENLKFKFTGPWPPYNFVNIRLKLERASEAE